MGVEKNGRYFKKMVFMSILVLMIDVIVRAFVLFLFFFKTETDGCRGTQMCYIHLYKKYIGYMYKLAMITRSYQNTTVNVFVVSEVDDVSELNLWSLFYFCFVVVASFDAVYLRPQWH